MSIENITSSTQFDNILNTPDQLIVIKWTADWCGPCKMIEPYYQKLSQQYPNVIFLHVDVDEQNFLAATYKIQAMPTFSFYLNKKLLFQFPGADINKLTQAVQKYAVDPIPNPMQCKTKGNEFFQKGDYQQAIKLFTRGIELDPNNHILYSNRSATFLKLNKLIESEQDAKKVISIKKEWDKGYHRLGTSLYLQGLYKEAEETFTKGLKESPNSKMLQENLKELEEFQKKHFDKEKSEEAKKKGNEFFNDGNFEKALEFYTEAIKMDPENPILFSNRAAAYTKLSLFDYGLRDCNKSIQIDPKFVKSYTRKGTILNLKGEKEEAKGMFEFVLKLDPENGFAKNQLEKLN
ncbi:tpr repeat containing protein [Anaeramoeba ignava]|uniref:Tpr repeat containing protein n=1 Tax=Anaeramoeba ignava TaxID=1746090 RepID=A0A9Q0R5V6_ANAIG|nr:tpr repeat containing protein [Anaeramoeba ignava]KAJ5068457.1 tpr repeat containing protein [Anaeramoeba ignava]